MPNKIKSKKQAKFLMGIAHGMKAKDGIGPSEETAKKMISHEGKKKISSLMKHGK